jgi:hypothetical protein
MVSQSMTALRKGDMAEAERIADECLQLGTEIGQPDAFSRYGALVIALRWHQGRLAELEPLIAQVAADTPAVPAFQAALALCRLAAQNRQGARELLAAAANDDFAAVPYDRVWTTTLALWAEIAGSLNAVRPSAVLANLLRPYADQVAYNNSNTLGPIADHLGQLETTLGHYDQADQYLDQAMRMHERFQAPFFLARTLIHRAQLCARRAALSDDANKRRLLMEAGDIARKHGYAGIERDMQALTD